ncbi:hypothetical protein ACT6QG_05340 [Xanthobacter sp. TB0136]|uniref:hypothetical protein n=1 Tax=Xanthobacter sp. TB0136 TaxID=3459177 RepID=UPI00403A5AC0
MTKAAFDKIAEGLKEAKEHAQSSMVERIAEAIYMGRNGYGAKPFRSQPKAHRGPYLKDATAALTAMRDPTLAMLEGPLNNPSREPSLYTAIWRAMVDAALASQPEQK